MSKSVQAFQVENSNFETFHQVTIQRRDLRSDDVAIAIKYCGICHSDIGQVQNEPGIAQYPMVPGHEITGIVTAVGSTVTKFQVGDRVGVGCFVNSCGHCKYCLAGQEQFCEQGAVVVFDADDYDGTHTQGGYSQAIVVKDRFVIHIPDNYSLAEAAPMMCAGITTYNPLMRYQIKPGMRVGVVGLGGLGHLAVQFAAQLGAEVTVFGHSVNKRNEAEKFGAQNYAILTQASDFQAYAGQFDFILNTIAVPLPVNQYLDMLTVDGVLCYVGLSVKNQEFNAINLFENQSTITASNVGGIALTQQMINFAAAHQVRPQIELIKIQDVAQAYRNVLASKVRYRYVIDMASLTDPRD